MYLAVIGPTQLRSRRVVFQHPFSKFPTPETKQKLILERISKNLKSWENTKRKYDGVLSPLKSNGIHGPTWLRRSCLGALIKGKLFRSPYWFHSPPFPPPLLIPGRYPCNSTYTGCFTHYLALCSVSNYRTNIYLLCKFTALNWVSICLTIGVHSIKRWLNE